MQAVQGCFQPAISSTSRANHWRPDFPNSESVSIDRDASLIRDVTAPSLPKFHHKPVVYTAACRRLRWIEPARSSVILLTSKLSA